MIEGFKELLRREEVYDLLQTVFSTTSSGGKGDGSRDVGLDRVQVRFQETKD
jgi:hypothetical protein